MSVRSFPERSTSARFALERLASLSIVPVRSLPERSTPVSITSVRSFPDRSTPSRIALERLAPISIVPVMSLSDKSARDRFALVKSTLTMFEVPKSVSLKSDSLKSMRSAPVLVSSNFSISDFASSLSL